MKKNVIIFFDKIDFLNKLNKNCQVVRNKEKLVWKGYAKEEAIDYGETFAPVVRLEGVMTLLA